MVLLILAVIAAFIAHVPMLRKEGCITEIYVFSALMVLCVVFGTLHIPNPYAESVSNAVLSIFGMNV